MIFISILIDTNFLVAIANIRDNNYPRANELLDDLLGGEWGPRISTDYVLDETITTIWSRTENHNLVENARQYFYGKHAIMQLVYLTEDIILHAWEIFQKYTEKRRPLSFTDCTLIAFMKQKKIDFLLSFDGEFDGIVTRVS